MMKNVNREIISSSKAELRVPELSTSVSQISRYLDRLPLVSEQWSLQAVTSAISVSAVVLLQL